MDLKIDTNTVVCFDLDDTLYKELDFLKSAFQAIAKHLAADSWQLLYLKMFSKYRNNIDVFHDLSLHYAIKKEALLNLYRQHFPEIQPEEHVEKVISDIRAFGGKIAVITDGRGITQRNKLEALNILEKLDLLLISEETGSVKPDRYNFKKVISQYPDHTYWYIADNLAKDFIAPNQLSWNTMALIDNGLNIHKEHFKHLEINKLPMFFINNFKELTITTS